jgi:hypothetical protein
VVAEYSREVLHTVQALLASPQRCTHVSPSGSDSSTRGCSAAVQHNAAQASSTMPAAGMSHVGSAARQGFTSSCDTDSSAGSENSASDCCSGEGKPASSAACNEVCTDTDSGVDCASIPRSECPSERSDDGSEVAARVLRQQLSWVRIVESALILVDALAALPDQQQCEGAFLFGNMPCLMLCPCASA